MRIMKKIQKQIQKTVRRDLWTCRKTERLFITWLSLYQDYGRYMYLELVLRNLLLDEKNELHNRSMHISGMFEEADIENTKADIENRKADIRNRLLSFSDMISEKTINHALELFSKCGKKEYFGRTIVEDITGLKSTRASELIKLLVDSKVIVPVKRFRMWRSA